MSRILQGSFGPACERCVRQSATKAICSSSSRTLQPYSSRTLVTATQIIRNSRHNKALLAHISATVLWRVPSSRGIASGAGRMIARFLKLRYVFATGVVGGGITLQKTFDSWREKIPDFKWIKDFAPSDESVQDWRDQFKRLGKNMQLPDLPRPKNVKDMSIMDSVKAWLDEVTSQDPSEIAERLGGAGLLWQSSVPEAGSFMVDSQMPAFSLGSRGATDTDAKDQKKMDRVEELQDELLKNQIRYQKEIEQLEKENRELRKTLMLRDMKNGRKRKMKKALIDMYSEVLDELSHYDSSYHTADHLPRVVVVGDQSSGKTRDRKSVV